MHYNQQLFLVLYVFCRSLFLIKHIFLTGLKHLTLLFLMWMILLGRCIYCVYNYRQLSLCYCVSGSFLTTVCCIPKLPGATTKHYMPTDALVQMHKHDSLSICIIEYGSYIVMGLPWSFENLLSIVIIYGITPCQN